MQVTRPEPVLEVDEPTHLVTEEARAPSSGAEDLRTEDIRPLMTDRAATVVEITLDVPGHRQVMTRPRPGTAMHDEVRLHRSASDMSIGKSIKSFGGVARAPTSRLGFRGATPLQSGTAGSSSRDAKTPTSRSIKNVRPVESRTAGKVSQLAKSYVQVRESFNLSDGKSSVAMRPRKNNFMTASNQPVTSPDAMARMNGGGLGRPGPSIGSKLIS